MSGSDHSPTAPAASPVAAASGVEDPSAAVVPAGAMPYLAPGPAAAVTPVVGIGVTDEPSDTSPSVQLDGGKSLRKYLLWLGISLAVITSVWGGVGSILLPNHVQLLVAAKVFTGADAGVDLQQLNTLKAAVAAGTATPTADQARQLGLLAQFDAARAQSLATVSTIGLLLTMFLGPVVGVISDRTRSRWGRRTPFILFGGVMGALALSAIQFAPSVAILTVLWAATSLFLNMAQGPITATVADRVVESRRGVASAIGGLGNFIGGVLGAVVAGVAFNAIGIRGYLIPAVLVVVGVVGFVVFAKDRSSKEMVVATHSWREFFAGFLVPLRAADFRWVWIARVVMTFGYGMSTAFSLYMLQSYIHPAMSQAQATAFAPILIAAGLPGTLVSLVVAGRWSDRVGRRKPFVIFASILMALSFVVPIASHTAIALLIQGILGGIAFGAYLSVDQALFIDVLPDKNSAGRDLGIAGLGSNAGQALGPVIGGQIVALTGGYQLVWVGALILVIAAAFVILPVKGVR